MKASLHTITLQLTRREALMLMLYIKESAPPWDNSWTPGYVAQDFVKALKDLGVKDE